MEASESTSPLTRVVLWYPTAMAHVLLVEDDEDLRDAMSSSLIEDGHEVATARNGVDALDALSRIAIPDVAVIDFYMPVMDGYELATEMRGNPRFAEIPIIVLSAATSIPHFPGTTALLKSDLRASLRREILRIVSARGATS